MSTINTTDNPVSHPITFRTFEKECSVYGEGQALRNIQSFAKESAALVGFTGSIDSLVTEVETALGGTFHGEYMNKIYKAILDRIIDADKPLTAAGLSQMEDIAK